MQSPPGADVRAAAVPTNAETMATEARSYSVGDVVHVSSDAPRDYRGRTGTVTEIGPGDTEYRVEFEDGERPTTGYLPAAWLNR